MFKRILLLHNYYRQWGGEDAVFQMECELLQRYGHEIETLTFNNDDIASLSSRVRAVTGLFYNSESARLLKNKIQAFQPDIIHIHNFFPLASPSVLYIAKQYNIPVVMTLHNFRLVCANALLFRNGNPCDDCLNQILPLKGIYRACYRNSVFQTTALTCMTGTHKILNTWRDKVDRYIMLNRFAQNKILNSSLHLRPEQVLVKPNFVFDPFGEVPPDKNTFNGSHKDKFFLFVGRLSVEKGITVLLEAFKHMDFSEFLSLKIVGKGPLEEQVREFSEAYSNVEYLGFQERPVILSLMKQAKALILPSTCYENFPMTIAESLASGTPVITSDTGGLPDIIQDGYNGFLVPVGNASSLRNKIKQMDQVDYSTLCYNARTSYLENYTPEQNYQQLLKIYEELLK